jgi:autoinducer 2-degrading protein
VPQMSIIVEYEIREGQEEELTALLKDHARRTLFEEPGCLRFDVLKPVDDGGDPIADRIMVSELYVDEVAVAAHGDNPRLASLRAVIAPLIRSRRVVKANVISEPAEEAGMTPEELNASNDG